MKVWECCRKSKSRSRVQWLATSQNKKSGATGIQNREDDRASRNRSGIHRYPEIKSERSVETNRWREEQISKIVNIDEKNPNESINSQRHNKIVTRSKEIKIIVIEIFKVDVINNDGKSYE